MTHTRQKERAEIAEMLEAGQSISMLAPRRIGKTWIMDRVAEDLGANGWKIVHIDVEGLTTDKQFVQKLTDAAEQSNGAKQSVFAHIEQRLRQFGRGSDVSSIIGAVNNVDPNELLELMIGKLNGAGNKTAILIDEIAVYLLQHVKIDPAATHALVYRMRYLQQKYTNVRWFLTGSVGLDVFAEQYDLRGAFTNYQTYPLEPFTSTEALSYCMSTDCQLIASRRFEFDDGAFAYLVEQLGWLSPYYLERVISRVRASQTSNSGRIVRMATTADIEAGIEAQLGHEYRSEFAPYEEHLRKNFLPDDTKRLKAILEVLVRHPNGEIEATLMASDQLVGFQMTPRQLKDDLLVLLSDGFIEQKADRWQFRSGLLRRYWLRYEV